ncbi:hypothetical protein GGI07_004242 [Coemansia sp. Benny D115]|nr:hypothetical protein GGI07_004242 [Coemansia sp. Benny D115]
MAEPIVDDFYTARNRLYLGAYPQVLSNLAQLTRTAPQFEVEKQTLQYRAYLGQGNYKLVLDEIPDSPSTAAPLSAIRQLAILKQDPASEPALAAVSELVAAPENLLSGTFVAIAAQALAIAHRHDEALRILAMHPKNLECVALSTAILLEIDRVDMAQKLVSHTRVWAEDAPIAQLAEAWTALRTGGQKYTEASYIFEGLAQASAVSTVQLLNSAAVAKMHLNQIPEAEALLQEALEKDSNNPDALANLIVCANLSAKPLETKARYISQLRDVAPNHPFVQDLAAKDAEFDAVASRLS